MQQVNDTKEIYTKIGFLNEKISVPNDFDSMNSDEILEMFEANFRKMRANA